MHTLVRSADAALLAAYLATEYRVQAPAAEWWLRVGARAPIAPPAAPRVHGLISACNPGSQLLSAAANTDGHAQLQAHLTAQGLTWWPAEGLAPDRSWREASCWLPDVDVTQLDALADHYGQNACVVVGSDGLTRLRLYRRDWQAWAGNDPRLQWPD